MFSAACPLQSALHDARVPNVGEQQRASPLTRALVGSGRFGHAADVEATAKVGAA